MKRVRFAEEQIIAVLGKHEAGAKTGDLARKHEISEATLYNWKAKYGGLDRLKALEGEVPRAQANARHVSSSPMERSDYYWISAPFRLSKSQNSR